MGDGFDVQFCPDDQTEYRHHQVESMVYPCRSTKTRDHDNAELLALSGPRNPYPGKQGVVEADALADLILVDGDPIANLDLMGNPTKNFLVIMKDGKIYKNALNMVSQTPAVTKKKIK
jgi:hypothetical protein